VHVCVCVCVEVMCVPNDAFVSEVSCIDHTNERWRGAIRDIFKNTVFQSIFLCFSLSFCVSIYLSVFQSIFLCFNLSFCVSIYLSVFQSIFLEDMRVPNDAFISDDIFEKYCVSICLSDTMS